MAQIPLTTTPLMKDVSHNTMLLLFKMTWREEGNFPCITTYKTEVENHYLQHVIHLDQASFKTKYTPPSVKKNNLI